MLLLEDLEEGTEIHLGVKDPNGERKIINGIDRINNTFEFYCPTEIFGEYQGQFFIIKGDKVTTSFPFKYTVLKNIRY